MSLDKSILLENDGLYMPEVGFWSKIKHQKVGYYCDLFANSMKRKWDYRAYIDLFASAGKCRVRNTNEVILGSPLLAMSVGAPFDKYVFCEEDSVSMDALKRRTQLYFDDKRCAFISGNTNENAQRVIDTLPTFDFNFKGLSLCFVDPYGAGDLKFSTLKEIADKIYVDFLVLIPSFMDINRNERNYTKRDNRVLDEFLGTSSWRDAWNGKSKRNQRFGDFIANEFGLQMKKIDFLYEGSDDMELVKNETDKNQRLYHLAFFSKHPLALKFWRDTVRNTSRQYRFF